MTGADRSGRSQPVEPSTDRLLLDTMLGKLAVYLRMCGYDASYVGHRDASNEDELADRARAEDRILVSRDRQLVARSERSVLLTEREVEAQLRELREAGFELAVADPPTRCGRCNGTLEPAPPEVERPEYAPASAEYDCWQCVDCGQFFWKGSHWDRVKDTV